MKVIGTVTPASDATQFPPLSAADIQELTEQLKTAFPTATEKLLNSAIEECRKESENPDDRQKLIRCVVERITA